ncbi:MAG: metal-dependent transcriptional regulator [Bacteroidia bacterium]|nr:metal-dependent transcriptional regulator [Bacteroidota bacterium]MBP6513040.1 metal-dependent transcriptional regulator [Bacteroidia bacterium]MBP7245910.1 metal-dependent transcriptional regulator [Bacteroidia bacterium]
MRSLTEENYLKAIYRISLNKKLKISPTAIADEMGVSAASVIDMIKKLSEKKLISYDKVKGAKLLERGQKEAVAIIRNHRLWEVFLLEKLNYSWDEIHDIAEQLEHVKHPELADRLDAFLGHPEYDPHGDPIPKSNGDIPTTVKTLLSEIEIGKSCRVVAVKDTSSVFLQYLVQLSVNIGTKIKVLDIVPFDNSMLLQIGKEIKTTVSKRFAESLLVD